MFLLEYWANVRAKLDKTCVTCCAVDRGNAVEKSGELYLTVGRGQEGADRRGQVENGVLFPLYSKT